MADESIIRDFSEERLSLIKSELQFMNRMQPEEGYVYESKDFFQTATVAGMEEVTRAAEKEALENFWACADADERTGLHLDEVWAEVDSIDQRYETMFTALKDRMNTYWSAVSDIAQMVSEGAISKGAGIGSSLENFQLNKDALLAKVNASKENYENTCIKDGLREAGYSEDEIEDMLDSVNAFATENGYTFDQKWAMVLNVSTEADREQFKLFLAGEFDKVFAMDPANISAGMRQNLSDYASFLTLSDDPEAMNKLQDYLNAITQVQLTEGTPPDYYDRMPIKTYAVEYLAALEQGLSAQYLLYREFLVEHIAYKQDGVIYWLDEPPGTAAQMQAFADKFDRLTSLANYYGNALYLTTTYRAVDYQLDPDISYFGDPGGFTISNLNFENGECSFNYTYQVDHCLFANDPNYKGHQIKNCTAAYNLINGETVRSLGGKSASFIYEDFQEISAARAAAQDKLLTDGVSSMFSLASAMVPGGSAAFSALKSSISIAQNALKDPTNIYNYGQNAASVGSDIYKGVTGDNAQYGVLSGINAGSVALGFLNSLSNYRSTMSNLDEKEEKITQNQLATWFGQRSIFSLSFSSDGKTGFYGGSDFPLGGDYNIQYAMQQWGSNGIASFVPTNDAYGLNGNSILGNYLYPNKPSPNSSAEWQDTIDQMNDLEILMIFGENPAQTPGVPSNVTIPTPSITLNDVANNTPAYQAVENEWKNKHPDVETSSLFTITTENLNNAVGTDKTVLDYFNDATN